MTQLKAKFFLLLLLLCVGIRQIKHRIDGNVATHPPKKYHKKIMRNRERTPPPIPSYYRSYMPKTKGQLKFPIITFGLHLQKWRDYVIKKRPEEEKKEKELLAGNCF